MFVSPTNPRVDLLQPFDGVYDEYGDRTDRGILDGYITANGRPCISWDHGPNRSAAEWHQYLQLKLIMGCTPTVPSPLGDHTLTNTSATVVGFFKMYAPLFAQLRGKRWLLRPHAVSAVGSDGSALWANIFTVAAGKVMAVVSAATLLETATAHVHLQNLPFSTAPSVRVLRAGAPTVSVTAMNVSASGGEVDLRVAVGLRFGGAVLLLSRARAAKADDEIASNLQTFSGEEKFSKKFFDSGVR